LTVAAALAAAAHAAILGAWLDKPVQAALTPQRQTTLPMNARQIGLAQPAVGSVVATMPEAASTDERGLASRTMPAPWTGGAPWVAPPAQAMTTVAAALPAPLPAPVSTPSGGGTPSGRDEALDPFASAGPSDRAEPAGPASGPPAAAPPAPPGYRTRLPPSLSLHYEVRRGEASALARLDWSLDGDGHYAIELRATTDDPATRPKPAALTPHWTSRGTLDAAGIAPERFAVSRRGRERHAANFQRDAGIVTFAGPGQTWPLVEGAQDRLSWMVQLSAVLQADPALAQAGATVSMVVVGAHGDADVWTFVASGAQTIEGPRGEPVVAVLLQRESRHLHDPQVQVWLAPDMHHLPLRMRLTSKRSGESTEFRLRTLQLEAR
jgi:hypothetical protein